MNITLDRRLALQERTATILARGAEIWTYGARTNKLLRYTGLQDRRLTLAAPLPSISVEDAALSWDGNHLLVADRPKRKVFQVDSASGQETLVMDPDSLSFGDHDTALLVEDSVIGDIAWYNGLLYLAVRAGYSSAFYGIDLLTNQVFSCRPAPGPRPCGLDFDSVDGSMFTVDNRNRELRRFSTTGEVDVAELPSEWGEPKGLSFGADRRLWSADWSTSDILCIRVED